MAEDPVGMTAGKVSLGGEESTGVWAGGYLSLKVRVPGESG